jgi:5-(carboxyamino)imidazole ribonucleotide mutase
LAVGKFGATNAGILAAQIVALTDSALDERVKSDREAMRESVVAKNARMREELGLPPESC